jgi:hypothetical protein
MSLDGNRLDARQEIELFPSAGTVWIEGGADRPKKVAREKREAIT